MCVRKWLLGVVGGGLVFGGVSAAWAETITHGSTNITMDFVSVGDANNTADTTGYGVVGYNYRIGTYEVTADQWAAVIAADPNVGNAGDWSGSQPTADTSWYEAAKFCNWLTSGDAATGAYSFTGPITSPTGVSIDRAAAQSTYGTAYFIPTENEWYKAAYYKGGGTSAGYWDYPTQDDVSSPPDGIGSLGDPDFDAVFYDGYNQDRPNNVVNAGVLSAYGTMGQGGNVWEWNETLVDSSSRGVRGGGWGFGSKYLRASYRNWYAPTYHPNFLGFRVASSVAVPEPGCITALAGLGLMAALGYVWRRRRRAA